MKTNKIQFLGGLGQPSKQERALISPHFDLVKIDWNYPEKTKIKKCDTLVGFSMGAIMASDYSLKHKVEKLVLCSLTPGAETMVELKADEVIFMVGEKEKWVLKDIQRLIKTKTTQKVRIVIVPKAWHRMDKNYLKAVLDITHKSIKDFTC